MTDWVESHMIVQCGFTPHHQSVATHLVGGAMNLHHVGLGSDVLLEVEHDVADARALADDPEDEPVQRDDDEGRDLHDEVDVHPRDVVAVLLVLQVDPRRDREAAGEEDDEAAVHDVRRRAVVELVEDALAAVLDAAEYVVVATKVHDRHGAESEGDGGARVHDHDERQRERVVAPRDAHGGGRRGRAQRRAAGRAAAGGGVPVARGLGRGAVRLALGVVGARAVDGGVGLVREEAPVAVVRHGAAALARALGVGVRGTAALQYPASSQVLWALAPAYSNASSTAIPAARMITAVAGAGQ
eukprot:CAMPEP_0174829388 /NCGR_PEP_ID=MMETSP1114-20130205/1902_1 /TAXON_ID=312471 /ORGANISM="Neobodo designis, Strain CCAP 1951/1" /LENGTH=299 /DNA_ID=CAMNT_0016063133 /DNA_START=68 /DNA_END=968 /DNA_ORIENTATION=-